MKTHALTIKIRAKKPKKARSCERSVSANGTVALLSETATADPQGEDFCEFGTHRQCLAALWKNGTLTALPTLSGGRNAEAFFVNNQGEIVGVSLYCFFIISHDRRRILHINVTKHPTSGWIIQQLREAFPFEASRKYLIFDRDQKFGFEVIAAVKATRIIPKRTSFRSPWQNGIAERWVGSCRRDLVDHIVALNERHLKRLLAEYVRYHHEDRTHLGLEKGTPNGRIRSIASGRVLAQERVGGLHHRYDRAA